MGAPRARTGPDLMIGGARRSGSAAAVLDFAVTQLLGDDTALGALPAVLARLADAFGLRAALAFQPSGARRSAAQPPTVLAVHPPGAADQALLARIGALTLAQRASVAARPLPVTMDGQAASALLAYSVPVGGQCLCALALIGDPAGWDDEIRATAHDRAAELPDRLGHPRGADHRRAGHGDEREPELRGHVRRGRAPGRRVRRVGHAPHQGCLRRPRRLHPAGGGGLPCPASGDRGTGPVHGRPHPRMRLLAGARGRPAPRRHLADLGHVGPHGARATATADAGGRTRRPRAGRAGAAPAHRAERAAAQARRGTQPVPRHRVA